MAYSDGDPEIQRARYEIRRFRQHLITFAAVIAILFLVNVLTGGIWFGHWLFFWILVIWGVVLAVEAVRLFGDGIGQDWEDRMVDRLVARRRGQTGAAPYVYTPPPPPRPPSPNAAGPSAAPVPDGPAEPPRI